MSPIITLQNENQSVSAKEYISREVSMKHIRLARAKTYWKSSVSKIRKRNLIRNLMKMFGEEFQRRLRSQAN